MGSYVRHQTRRERKREREPRGGFHCSSLLDSISPGDSLSNETSAPFLSRRHDDEFRGALQYGPRTETIRTIKRFPCTRGTREVAGRKIARLNSFPIALRTVAVIRYRYLKNRRYAAGDRTFRYTTALSLSLSLVRGIKCLQE